MNKKVTLGICIPYFCNHENMEREFRKLMQKLDTQLTENMILYVYEDGQVSDWLQEYKRNNIIIDSNKENKGVSHARNVAIDYLIDKVMYILFIDADDDIDDTYLKVMFEYCADNSHEIVESAFFENGVAFPYEPKQVRCGAAGSAIACRIIGNKRFEQNLQVGEDTDFMFRVCDLNRYRKRRAPSGYHYQLGINPNSLTMLYQRKEIGKERNGNIK